MVGVYYYPWHGGDNFHGRRYLREHLVPVQKPELGEYNDRKSEVIKQHLEWCEYAGIGLWVSSWWGPGRMTDVTLKDYILKHDDLNEMKIALFYETSGRMPDFTDVKNVASDINYMTENYFDHPNYFRIDGKPVLFIYLTRVLSRNGILKNTVDIMRDAASKAGFGIYLVGDQVFGKPPSSTDQLALLDAVTNYDVYGSSGGRMYATQEKVDTYYQAQTEWRSMAHQVGTRFIPASAPGYNDTAVRDGHVPLSRKLSENDELGSLFKAMVHEAIKITDHETGNLFMVTSWNEWHEDTQIEPVAVAPATSRDDSNSGEDYTAGLEYEGYGMKYLDILKEALER
jgi:glycoprotein endo-alpha-1,2-mannosidase